MELVLLKNRPLNTVLTDEKDGVRYRTQTPFKLTKRTTTITRCSDDRINDTCQRYTMLPRLQIQMHTT